MFGEGSGRRHFAELSESKPAMASDYSVATRIAAVSIRKGAP